MSVKNHFFGSKIDYKKNLRQIWPSPPRIPILGSLPFIIGKDISQQCWEWRKKYGPIFALKLGTSSESLMVCGAALARELLVIKGYSLKTRQNPLFYAKELRLDEFFPPAMTTTAHVITQRQLLSKAIRESISQGEGNCVDRDSKYFLCQLQKRIKLSPKPDKSVGILETILECSVVCAISLGFGFRWSPQELNSAPEGREVVKLTGKFFEMLESFYEPTIPFSFLVSLLSWRTKRLRREAADVSKRILSVYSLLYERARQSFESENISIENSVAKTLFTSETNADLSDFEKFCLAGVAMASSTTTTSYTIYTIIGCLAAYPEWQNRAHKEIDDYLKTLDSEKDLLLPSTDPEELRNFPIIKAIVDETIRLFPVFPILDRIADDDIALSDGRQINKGQRIFFLYHSINRDTDMFKDPEEFNPNRFLKNKSNYDDFVPKVTWEKYGHSSFSGGRRACPGSQFALHKAMCYISRLLYCYEFKFKNNKVGLENIKAFQTGVERVTHIPDLIFKPRVPNLDKHLEKLSYLEKKAFV
ncbi:cytochrome P450 monooxygenase [Phakopsora pachyrhizi]|uniref:Cytochrome P450 monooxygenase n=1 Tax=Phakopsora pachyrhizi TaxID=170000 RepID=A0AAV0BP69_PHAPC|nr:cytochrome P450 monooxygenase [Phakopsora pachyrhizi]CAH7687362.1 cytochrome P450 monooxygenase [Phakopsora pachyrhizi]